MYLLDLLTRLDVDLVMEIILEINLELLLLLLLLVQFFNFWRTFAARPAVAATSNTNSPTTAAAAAVTVIAVVGDVAVVQDSRGSKDAGIFGRLGRRRSLNHILVDHVGNFCDSRRTEK